MVIKIVDCRQKRLWLQKEVMHCGEKNDSLMKHLHEVLGVL
jgi:hypothetical protein